MSKRTSLSSFSDHEMTEEKEPQRLCYGTMPRSSIDDPETCELNKVQSENKTWQKQWILCEFVLNFKNCYLEMSCRFYVLCVSIRIDFYVCLLWVCVTYVPVQAKARRGLASFRSAGAWVPGNWAVWRGFGIPSAHECRAISQPETLV